MRLHDVRLTFAGGGGGGQVEVDGHDLSHAVRAVDVRAAAGHPAEVVLYLAAPKGVNLDGQAQVSLPQATYQALVDLGWTPPPDGQ